MATTQVKNALGIVDKRMAPLRSNANSQYNGTVHTNTKDVAALRARLTAINPTSYTSARLDAMTVNDMIFAIRQNDDPGSI